MRIYIINHKFMGTGSKEFRFSLESSSHWKPFGIVCPSIYRI